MLEENDSLARMLVEVAAPHSIVEISRRVESELLQFLTTEHTRWMLVDADFAIPIEALRRFVISGGKRLRPAFCFWTAVGLGLDPSDPGLMKTLLGLELLHTFALIHDDLMDRSALRRGEPSVHTAFATQHRQEELRGSSAQYGDSMAILVGDLAFAYADQMLIDANRRARQLYSELKLEVNLGQSLDISGSFALNTTLAKAERIALYKSGKYTVERPMHIGAAMAGRYFSTSDAITRFAVPLGMAFQLRDDVLGVFGMTERTKKPVGDDLREGKQTLLIGLACQRCTSSERELFEGLFGRDDLSVSEITALQVMIEETGALQAVEDRIDQLFLRSMQALDELPIIPEARAALGEMAGFVVDRLH
ncbi:MULTISPECIES: polyprenyl synthetase family protein [Ferrimicrobium]|uniref:Polyprenyl synthetase family protein n=1 Tax=Ferrimicrobium acidiphilum TaxID=121039 RepID=A0ABV3XYS9_9ACTN|nr:polyprenyl synthetase family protein [Ferrimicrobium sp.]MCL5973933.1 polyprenyl synthetase family protein [Actinomycetota bacterium]